MTAGGIDVRLFQSLINQIRESVDGNFGIMDDTGLILGCTDEQLTGTTPADRRSHGRCREKGRNPGMAVRKVYIRNRLEFIVYTDIANEHGKALLAMFAINVSTSGLITRISLTGAISLKTSSPTISCRAISGGQRNCTSRSTPAGWFSW